MYAFTQEEPSFRVTTLCKSHISYITTLQLRSQTSVLYTIYIYRHEHMSNIRLQNRRQKIMGLKEIGLGAITILGSFVNVVGGNYIATSQA